MNGVKPAMETFNPVPFMLNMICWPLIPCICTKMCAKYEEKKNWNIQRMGEDFDECLYFKRSFLCCCVLFCDCCCKSYCSCIWTGEVEKQKLKNKKSLAEIAKLEGQMGIEVDKKEMMPEYYLKYLEAKKKVSDDAILAASKPPPSRSVRDIKMMIIQSMIENNQGADALQLLKELDTVKSSEIEKYREETPTSLRTKGLRMVAGVLQVAGSVVPGAGAVGLVAGFAADISEYSDKKGDSSKSPVQSQPSSPAAAEYYAPAPVVVAPVAVPAASRNGAVAAPADPSYDEFLEYQKFIKSKSGMVGNPLH